LSDFPVTAPALGWCCVHAGFDALELSAETRRKLECNNAVEVVKLQP
jgi:hypothetical protein